MRQTFAIALLVGLSGCMTAPDTHSTSYQLGFAEGCTTASTEVEGVPRDPQRRKELFEFDAGYRSGWITGHAQCEAPFPVSLFVRRN